MRDLNISRQVALNMPHWEVLFLVEGYYAIQAQKILAFTDAVALGSGTISDENARKNLVASLVEKCGLDGGKKKKVKDKSTPFTAGLEEWIGGGAIL